MIAQIWTRKAQKSTFWPILPFLARSSSENLSSTWPKSCSCCTFSAVSQQNHIKSCLSWFGHFWGPGPPLRRVWGRRPPKTSMTALGRLTASCRNLIEVSLSFRTSRASWRSPFPPFRGQRARVPQKVKNPFPTKTRTSKGRSFVFIPFFGNLPWARPSPI